MLKMISGLMAIILRRLAASVAPGIAKTPVSELRRSIVSKLESNMKTQRETFKKGDRVTSGWIKCSDRLPLRGEVVATKIDDADGCRNEGTLKRGSGRLWFLSDNSMYVYYTPTHWRPLPTSV